MPAVTIYGIKNCDTMKKAFRWLEENGVLYDFHDYKKDGADISVLKKAIDAHGWESVINIRGTTWRKLDDTIKEQMDERVALEVAKDNTSIIKRPIIAYGGELMIGYDENTLSKILT